MGDRIRPKKRVGMIFAVPKIYKLGGPPIIRCGCRYREMGKY